MLYVYASFTRDYEPSISHQNLQVFLQPTPDLSQTAKQRELSLSDHRRLEPLYNSF